MAKKTKTKEGSKKKKAAVSTSKKDVSTNESLGDIEKSDTVISDKVAGDTTTSEEEAGNTEVSDTVTSDKAVSDTATSGKEASDTVTSGKESDTSTSEKEASDEEETPEKKSLKEKLTRKIKGMEGEQKEEIGKNIEADENKDGYVSAREVVNTIDDDIKIIEKSEDEILANHVAEQLRDNEDYFIVRIRKSIALIIVGISILLLWIIPLIPQIKNLLGVSQEKIELTEQEKTSTSPATPTAESLNLQRIRIKIDSQNDKSASISSLLRDSGFSYIDITEVELEEEGVSVVVKKGDDELRSELISILMDEYDAGSSSSELTVDSDFSAVILIGK